ncbi:MAG: M20/M25/M40 family metallo-hydrolase, partial [Pseudomonadales bacterium]
MGNGMVRRCVRLVSTGLLAIVTALAFAADYDQEIETLAGHDEIQIALSVIDETSDEALDWLVEINEIPAPPFKEDVRAGYYMQLMRNVGVADVSIDEEGNVLARIPGRVGNKTVAVVAHLDTVFPEGTKLLVHRSGNEYCAPGIGDNSRGLVAMLVLAKAIITAEIPLDQDVLLVGSVGEEGIGNLRGVRHLLRDDGPFIDEFIAIDGGGASRMTLVAVGSIRYRLKFKGPGGHSWGAFGRANPAHALARAIYYFDEAASRYVNSDGAKVTYNIGRMGGGTSVNSIPFENWAEIDMRSVDPGRLKRIDELLTAAISRALAEQNELRTLEEALSVEKEEIGFRPAGETPVDSPLIQRFMAAMRHHGIE